MYVGPAVYRVPGTNADMVSLSCRDLMYTLPHYRSLQSPPQTQTPQTLSDAGSEMGSPQQNMNSQPGGGPSGVRRPGNGPGPTMQESPNARSKSITVASGNDTFGVSCLVPLSHHD